MSYAKAKSGEAAPPPSFSPTRTLAELHTLVCAGRDTGNGHHVISRLYPSGDCEITSVQLTSEDSLRRGGGAKRESQDKDSMKKGVLFKSLQRTKTKIRRLCLSAQFDRMLTLTFRENLQDLAQAWKVFKYFSKLMKWRYQDRYVYVAVPEFQQRGAVHFHLAIKGYHDVNTVRKLWLRACGKYEGNIDITCPRKTAGKNSWNPKRIANYISKYISKTDSVALNKKRYSSGGEIPLPQPIYGWLPLGGQTLSILFELVSAQTRKSVTDIWQSKSRYTIYMIST